MKFATRYSLSFISLSSACLAAVHAGRKNRKMFAFYLRRQKRNVDYRVAGGK